MSYLALARKWRPRRFADLVGQEHVVRALTHALDSGRLHHALLFTGTRGVGKTTIARIFAKALNCVKGPTSEPCGECSACVDIDAGRFVDLIEIDAASNTGIDNVRDLIDNAQYTPSRGRTKVYLIDEVHMLSKAAFNALLKTLEEPPPHVEFLLATTDPQRLPITVLSRCLKFTLKRLTQEQIAGQLTRILASEGVAADAEAVDHLARAADGSLRDGLSLLDQAIAHGGGKLASADVDAMLGTVDRNAVRRLLEALASGDAATLMSEIDASSLLVPDFGEVLDDFAGLLHRVQVLQLVPDSARPEDVELQVVAGRLAPEDVQLWYQMAVSGRRDLPLAPTPRLGFEMTLLRMLAFVPVAGSAGAVHPASPGPGATATARAGKAASPPALPAGVRDAPKAEAPATPSAPRDATVASAENWPALIDAAGLRGPLREVASHAVVLAHERSLLRLGLNEPHIRLVKPALTASLVQKLAPLLGEGLAVRFERVESDLDSPAARRRQDEAERREAAESTLGEDPVVRAMVDAFDARIVPGSVQPPVAENGK